MDDMGIYILIGIFVLLMIVVMWRDQRQTQSQSDPRDGNWNDNERGRGRPQYDDPTMRGSGHFGGRESRQRRRDYQWMGNRTASESVRQPQDSSRRDSSRVEGQGGFGRDKD